jgi:hypothetical protein
MQLSWPQFELRQKSVNQMNFPDEANGWFKIAGPIEQDTAWKIYSSLEKFFSQNGVRVKKEAMAD